jgi:hypothetical protein
VALGHWAADSYTQHLHQKENKNMKMKTLFAYFFRPDGLDKQPIYVELPPGPPLDGPPFKAAPEPPPFEVSDDLIENDGFPSRQVQKLEDQEPFVWETNDGNFLELRNMATPHLFYTLRMIFNHSVPPAFRVGEFRRRANIDRWPLDYREQAGHEIRGELRKRADLDPWMKGEVQDMVANAAYLDGKVPSWQVAPRIDLRPYTADDLRKMEQIPKKITLLEKLARERQAAAAEQKASRKAKRMKRAAAEQKASRKAKRMKRAVPTDLRGLPGKRCMEHRSYAGIRKSRTDCNACKQVYRARLRRRHSE